MNKLTGDNIFRKWKVLSHATADCRHIHARQTVKIMKGRNLTTCHDFLLEFLL